MGHKIGLQHVVPCDKGIELLPICRPCLDVCAQTCDCFCVLYIMLLPICGRFLGVFSLGLQADVVTASPFCASCYCQYVAHFWMSARRLVTAFVFSTSCYCHFVSLLGVFSLGLQADVVTASLFMLLPICGPFLDVCAQTCDRF